MTQPHKVDDSAAKPGAKSKYDYSKGPLPLKIDLSWCKACNLCIALCPQQVFEPDRDGKPVQARPENCTQCTICWVHCPDFAITSNYK
ncbi:MAG: 4Fe-4S binding protein [Candidatus Zixiibacteriota bacterium]|nr:MAG: 4Fe-4S binding protein [candidate division Zixibacteria bacterium]